MTTELEALRRLGRALADRDAKELAAFHARNSPELATFVDARDAAVAEVNVARCAVDEHARALAARPSEAA